MTVLLLRVFSVSKSGNPMELARAREKLGPGDKDAGDGMNSSDISYIFFRADLRKNR